MKFLVLVALCLVTVTLRDVWCYTECDVNTIADYTMRQRRRSESDCESGCTSKSNCLGYLFVPTENKKCKWLWKSSTGTSVGYNTWNVKDDWYRRVCPDLKYSFDGNDAQQGALTFSPDEATVVRPGGVVGNAANLSATNDFINIGSPVKDETPLSCNVATKGCSGFSVALWLNISQTSEAYGYILHGKQFRLRDTDGTINGYFNYWLNNTHVHRTRIERNEPFTEYDEWKHWAMTYDTSSSDLKLYIDGVEQVLTQTIDPVEAQNIPDPFPDVHLGSQWRDPPTYNGLLWLDEFLAFDDALTSVEVQDLYHTY